MDFLQSFHEKAFQELGVVHLRWIFGTNLVRTSLDPETKRLVVEAGPAGPDLMDSMIQLKRVPLDTFNEVLQDLVSLCEKHCVCAAGHPLMSMYRTKPNACICGSYFEALEKFSETYGLCAATGRPLMVEGCLEGFHCFSRTAETPLKMALRYCQETTSKGP